MTKKSDQNLVCPNSHHEKKMSTNRANRMCKIWCHIFAWWPRFPKTTAKFCTYLA